eukprot:366399-Chlamydomonas_euryale.AAC.31
MARPGATMPCSGEGMKVQLKERSHFAWQGNKGASIVARWLEFARAAALDKGLGKVGTWGSEATWRNAECA